MNVLEGAVLTAEFEVKAANVNALKITFKALDQKQEMPQIDDSTIGVILNVKAE